MGPYESIRLFALCQQMKWAHLPVAGGLYDQHPQLIEEWSYIFAQQNARDNREAEKQKAESKRSSVRRR